MRKTIAFILVIMLVLAGCGGGGGASEAASKAISVPASQPAAPSVPAAPAAPATLKITFSNASSFIFNEIYISPTAANEWGADLLGSSSVLKSNGSIDLEVPAYDFENYDVMVVDEERDTYRFTRVPMKDGNELAIYFGENGLAADVIDGGKTATTVAGTLDTGEGNEAPAAEAAPEPVVTGTGNDTNGQYTFTVYNESLYDIYAISMGVANASSSADIDILPRILSAGESIDLSGVASQGDWLNTEWTMYITDVDGDSSASYDSFNPWTVAYINVQWSSDAGGYVCEFVY